jgi:seryl-tRNA synthetase
MLDVRYVCDNLELVKQKLALRNSQIDLDKVSVLNSERIELIKKVEALKAKRNSVSDEIAALKRERKDADKLISDMKLLGDDIKLLDERLNSIESGLKELLLNIPNIPSEKTPIGKDESENKEIRKHLEPTKFDFEPKPHWEIGEALGVLDFATAAKLTGARFTLYKNLGAKLERALISFMLDAQSKAGYEELLPPVIVNRESMQGTGQLPKFEEDMFALKNTNYYLIPTAEVPVTNIYRDCVLDYKQLPLCYCAYTPCFRAEAGSAGRDTRGIIRQHQFNKVELVKFTHPDESYAELEKLTANAENILKLLGLPYRVVALCTGDIGFASAKTYDIEVWMPSYNRYVEISSCSNFEDFQARRANIKFKDKDGKLRFAHTLNGSGLAIGRTFAAVLENFQNADGSVTIPKALHKYTKFKQITK